MSIEVGLRQALEDLVREQGINLRDVLDMMDEQRDSVVSSLSKISTLDDEQLSAIEAALSHRQINLVVFAVYAFYLGNLSGLYKGMAVVPRREDVMSGQRVTLDGLRQMAKALGIGVEGLPQ